MPKKIQHHQQYILQKLKNYKTSPKAASIAANELTNAEDLIKILRNYMITIHNKYDELLCIYGNNEEATDSEADNDDDDDDNE